MARHPRFDDDDVLDAALAAIAEHGRDASIAQFAAALGGPTGSIYHRFGSRDELVARLWLRSIRRFHATFTALEPGADTHDTLVRLAGAIPRYCREHPREALGMTLHRQDRLLAWAQSQPALASLADDVREVNDEFDAVSAELTAERFPWTVASDAAFLERQRLVLFATRIGPYGYVRPYLGRDVPAWLDPIVEASADAVLRLGDEEAPAH